MSAEEYDAIDPAWWKGALRAENDDPSAGGWVMPELASGELRRLANACRDRESLQARTLTAMADVTSAMLCPDSPGGPFRPAMSWADGGRTILPSDLDDAQFDLLLHLAPRVFNPLVRARIADAVWTHGPARDRDVLMVAVDAYLETPLEPDAWRISGQDSWRRAVSLLRSQGRAHTGRIVDIRHRLLTRLLGSGPDDGWMPVELGNLLYECGRPDQFEIEAVANHLHLLAKSDSIAPRLRRHLLRGARSWFTRARETEAAFLCTTEIAQAYEGEGVQRLTEGGGQGMAAGHYFEKAIRALIGLPRRYRLEHGLDDRIRELRGRLSESREVTLESMVAVDTEPLDITNSVEKARQQISGREQFDALSQLAGMLPLTHSEEAFKQARDGLIEHPLSRLFPGETFSRDGRRVAAAGGGGGVGDPADSEVWAAVVRDFGIRSSLVVQACIVPARDVLVAEHHVSLDDLDRICWESPVVPPEHVRLWARGLWHGLHGDLPSAITMLVPQIEQLVRQMLKANGVYTLTVDEQTGVESERGLGALLMTGEAEHLLGSGLQLELRALLVEQGGANLRNVVAHGLLADDTASSLGAVYAWWLCLRMVVLPVWTMRQETA